MEIRRGALSCRTSALGSPAWRSNVMLHSEGFGNQTAWSPPTGRPHFAPKAKNVIWLFMNGGVSHMESFDPKPMLNKYAGKTIAETPFADTQDPKKLAIERLVAPDANGNRATTLYPMQIGFRKHGESGIEVSDYFPRIGANVDRLAIVRSMWTTDSNHGAQTQFHSGRHMNDGEFPTLGAWVHYGLGSLNENLPQFISIGTRPYWNMRDGLYLGPAHDAVPLRIDPKNPLDFGTPEREFSAEARAVGIDLSRRLNAISEERLSAGSGARGADRFLRAGVSHADVGAGSHRLLHRDGRNQEALRTRPAALPRVWRRSSWRRGGSSSAACGSFKFNMAAAAPALGTPTRASRLAMPPWAAGWTNRSPRCSKTSTRAGCSMKRWWSLPPSSAALRARRIPTGATIIFSGSPSGWPAAA